MHEPGGARSIRQAHDATHAVWICACVTMEDAPTWPIYEDGDGRILWDRIPDGAEASDLVDAHSIAGGHTDPGDVPAWFGGKTPDPWASGSGWGDDGVLGELMRKIPPGTGLVFRICRDALVLEGASHRRV